MRYFLRDERLNPYSNDDNITRAKEVLSHKEITMLTHREVYRNQVNNTLFEKKSLLIVILTVNKIDLIESLVKSLIDARQSFLPKKCELEVLIGDTGSTDDKVISFYKDCPSWILSILNMPYHFSKCNNELFFNHVKSRYTLFLNNDVIFDNAFASLSVMVDHLESHPRTAIISPWLYYLNGKIQHAGIDFFGKGSFFGLCFHPYHGKFLESPVLGKSYHSPAVTGACFMVRSDVFDMIGGFDEGYKTECQDIALCLAARRLGYDIELIYAGHIVHLENATRSISEREDWKDRQRLIRKWGAFIEAEILS